ncbi:hypothetical protein KIPB_013888, partial [Kipferlia bialata]
KQLDAFLNQVPNAHLYLHSVFCNQQLDASAR